MNVQIPSGNACEVLGLYLECREAKVGRLTAFDGRFRYSALKEALTAASTMGFQSS
jgi:hypothetical protein